MCSRALCTGFMQVSCSITKSKKDSENCHKSVGRNNLQSETSTEEQAKERPRWGGPFAAAGEKLETEPVFVPEKRRNAQKSLREAVQSSENEKTVENLEIRRPGYVLHIKTHHRKPRQDLPVQVDSARYDTPHTAFCVYGQSVCREGVSFQKTIGADGPGRWRMQNGKTMQGFSAEYR